MTRFFRLVALAPVVLLAASLAGADEPAPAPTPPAAATPVPDAGWAPAIRRGVLPLGLTYLVRRNARPERRLVARVVKRVGALQEQDAERGLAHFCEHMAFNGSPHFPPGALINGASGISLSPHVNASTGWDVTTCVIDVPAGTPAEMARALDLVEDFVRGSTLEPKEIEKERGVVLAELRSRRGPDERLSEAWMRVAFGARSTSGAIPADPPTSSRARRPKTSRTSAAAGRVRT